MTPTRPHCPARLRFPFRLGLFLGLFAAASALTHAQYVSGSPYSDRHLPNELVEEIEALRKKADHGEALDEALGGKTLRGTPVHPRTPAYFPSEQRDIFWEMDKVADADGNLLPINFDIDGDGTISDRERDAIRGRNTWLLWGGGNEAFWGWLQERGYGITDFLILLDSRDRYRRFQSAGLINQPGFRSVAEKKDRILGLYLDLPDPNYNPPQPKDRPPILRPYLLGKEDKPYSYKPYYEAESHDAQGRPVVPAVGVPRLPGGGLPEPFEVGETDPYYEALRKLPRDGLDYSVYGYPSGIFGLRLFPNPDFFGKTKAAKKAREYWDERVVSGEAGDYYRDQHIHMDPHLVRPFRVAMSCGFCHVGPHPLNPPDDPERPDWENLSSIIGDQYWKPQPAFGNLLTQTNFLHHFLKSQPPGTIDTSLVSTDHLNNTNVINAIFDVPARLERAGTKPAELQAGDNLLFLGKQPDDDPVPLKCPMVLFPGEDSVGVIPALARVPLNIGVFSEQWARSDNPVIGFAPQRPFRVATSRTNSVYWMVNERYRVPYMADFFTHAPKPSAIPSEPPPNAEPDTPDPLDPEVDEAESSPPVPKAIKATQPMKLKHAKAINGGKSGLDYYNDDTDAERDMGRRVFLKNCAICHSSKQPEGFDLQFQREMKGGWDLAPAPGEATESETTSRSIAKTDTESESRSETREVSVFMEALGSVGARSDTKTELASITEAELASKTELVSKRQRKAPGYQLVYTLPMSYEHWEHYRRSPSFAHYRRNILALAEKEGEGFLENNFLSNELRIPVTLVGTNAARALATNAMRGNVWDNYSSETFKTLPSVGKIRFYNPFSGDPVDAWGTNDEFDDGRESGGPGYLRPPSLISLWATAPYFHNNAIGLYNHNPSVEGWMEAFDDGIRKILSNDLRDGYTRYYDRYENRNLLWVPPGDLREQGALSSRTDPGYIYRLPVDTHVEMAPGFIRPLIEGIAGEFVFKLLSFWIWVVLVIAFLAVALYGKARHAGVMLLLLGVGIAAILAITGAGGFGGTVSGALVMSAANMMAVLSKWFWLVPAVLVAAGIWLSLTRRTYRRAIFLSYLVLTLLVAGIGILANKFLNGRLKDRHPVVAVLPNAWTSGQLKGVKVGPIPKGTPVDLLMSIDPEKKDKLPAALIGLARASVRIKKEHLAGEEAYKVFAEEAGPGLLDASKCPDYVLDRGHWFGEHLKKEEKEALIAFLKTL